MKTKSHFSYEHPQLGVYMNTDTVEKVFKKYEEIGFLYPAKKKLLQPHFSKITKNWKRLYTAKEKLLWILSTTDDKSSRNFASISVWKQSNKGLFAQHLVSTGNPFLSLKVMLQAQYIAQSHRDEKEVTSCQNWFRPNNRYAYRIFASMFDKLGTEKASLLHFYYLHQALDRIQKVKKIKFQVEEVKDMDLEFIEFVEAQYGRVFVQAEELNQEDIRLEGIGAIFQKYQLQRYRKVLKFRDKETKKIIGATILNRAPLGLNFSFLENRAYYILDKKLADNQRTRLIKEMHHASKASYEDIALQAIPIVTDARTAKSLQEQGTLLLREYMQSIWLREGFMQWYEHIYSFLQRIERKTAQ